ncbi:hypothetical protein B2J88_48110 [Rhodococcus sp. SRB_17]|nr:hypothetical protein [Rhodococcus sp. SRB_17]
MSNAIYSTVHFQIPRSTTGRSLSRAASQLVMLFEGAIELRPHRGGPMLTIHLAIERSLGLEIENCITSRTPDGHFETKVSGEGRHSHLLEVTKILAAAGFTGEVCYQDVDSINMRLRLADGTVHIGRGDLVYTETEAR